VFVLCLALAAVRVEAQTQRPELRAFWADGFNEGYKTPEQIDALIARLKQAQCNAVFAQVRARGDAYYFSRIEPWARDNPQQFDALAALIEKAHAQNPPIAVHAWINTCAVGGNARNPFSLVALHPDWLSINPQANDFDNEATKIDPGHPAAADWTFRVYLDVARHYNVDGIHFDFVRYGGPEWGYNPVSVARFRQQFPKFADWLPGTELPKPNAPQWKQWRRDQVSALVRKVYAHALQIKPQLVVSAASICWGDAPQNDRDWRDKSAAMNRVFQDWRGWLEEGIIDLACPMTYFQAARTRKYQENWSRFIKARQYGRAATVAVGNWMNTIPQTLDLMQIARAQDSKGRRPYGVMLYSYAGTNTSEDIGADGKREELKHQPEFYAALGEPSQYADAPPFAADVPIPSMPWKMQPKHGHIKGFVLTPDLTPIDGATVTIRARGKTITRRTDGTGFYAAIDLPPGKVTVHVKVKGVTPQTATAEIAVGTVQTAHFTIGTPAVPLTRSIAALRGKLPGNRGIPNALPVRLANLRVTLGTDTLPGYVYVIDENNVGLRVKLPRPPDVSYQPGDMVSAVGTIRVLDGEPTLDASAVHLTDITLTKTLPAPVKFDSKTLRDGGIANGILITLEGTITKVNASGWTLHDGVEIRIPLAGRKDPNVEAQTFSVPKVESGMRVGVTGIPAAGTDENGLPTIRLHPRLGSDIQILPSRPAWQGWAAIAGGIAAVLFFVLLHRRRKRIAARIHDTMDAPPLRNNNCS
jgi:uncharacterized lipoprotein YddW (UPF0748 family)